MPHETPNPPLGFEGLSPGACDTIFKWGGKALAELEPDYIEHLLLTTFAKGSSLSSCTPDGCKGIRKALQARMEHLSGAALHEVHMTPPHER